MKSKKLVVIEWLDSKGIHDAWEYISKIKPLKPVKCISVGFLIDDNKKYKTLVQSIGNGQVLGRMTIPVCSIDRIEEI
jgi:transcription antitermination factor NusA-like protein